MPRKKRSYKRDKNGRFAKSGGGGSSSPKQLGRVKRGVHIPASGAGLALNAVGAASGNPKSQKKLLGRLLGRMGGQAKKNRIEGTVTVTGEQARYVVTVRRDPYGRHKSKKGS